MATNRGQKREVWGLVTMFAVFLIFVTYSQRVAQEATTPDTPSMYNPKGAGLKALQLLLERQGHRVSDLRDTWSSLSSADGLLLVVEPLSAERNISSADIRTLKSWVEAGGSVLYLLTAPERDWDPSDALFGDVAVMKAEPKSVRVSPASSAAPFMQEVNSIEIDTPVRLKSSQGSRYTVLLKDDQGDILLYRPLGKGQLVIGAATSLATNGGIRSADNALLMVNLVQGLRSESRPVVRFDEYHHGVGAARSGGAGESGILDNFPSPLRLGLLHLIGLGLLLVYNNNRRFGKRKTLTPLDYRSSLDYVGALAKLYQRAGGSDIALLTLYDRFSRDLTRTYDLSPDSAHEHIVERVSRQAPEIASEVQQLLARCESVRSGARIGETEMLTLMKQMETLRRRMNLVGHA